MILLYQPTPPLNQQYPANILSARLPDSILRFHDPRRFKRPTHHTVFYSQDATTTPSGKTLYGIPIHPSELRDLLKHADKFGRTQDSNEFSSSFRASANGLTLVMNAIASTSGDSTFNWAAYADVAKIPLDNTGITGNELIDLWVGVVKNPSRKIVAEMGAIPESIVVPGVPRSSSSRKLKSRLAKRDTYAIQGTSYQLICCPRCYCSPGSVLANIAKYVLDNVLLEPAFKSYTALLTNDQLRVLWGPNAMSLVAHGGVVIACNDMLKIVRTIFFVVDPYSSRRTIFGLRRRNLLRNLQGQVIGAAGNHIATWAIGGVPPQDLAAASVCPGVGVTEPDGSLALGCVRTCSVCVPRGERMEVGGSRELCAL